MNAKLAFYKGKGNWIDKLIRFWTKSNYSHVEIVFDDMWYSISPRDNYIRRKKIDFKEENWDFIEIQINSSSFEEFFKKTEGMKYDWLGIFLSQVFPLNVDAKNRYFCSEWCSEALGVSPKLSNLYSPEDLYKSINKTRVN